MAVTDTAQANGQAGTKYLSVEDILAVDDCPTDDLLVPEWGGWIKVRGLSRQQVKEIKDEATVNGRMDEDRAEMLLLVKGIAEPQFTGEQCAGLAAKSVGAVTKVLGKIRDLSGLNDNAVEKAQASFRP